MAEGESVLGQQRFGGRTAQARLEGRGHRVGVDLEQLVEAHQVEGHDAGVPLTTRDQSTHHGGAAAERDQRHVPLDRPGDQGRDLVVGAGAHDRVR